MDPGRDWREVVGVVEIVLNIFDKGGVLSLLFLNRRKGRDGRYVFWVVGVWLDVDGDGGTLSAFEDGYADDFGSQQKSGYDCRNHCICF